MSQRKTRGGGGHRRIVHHCMHCKRGSKFACNKTKKKQLPALEMSHTTKTSQSIVLILAASLEDRNRQCNAMLTNTTISNATLRSILPGHSFVTLSSNNNSVTALKRKKKEEKRRNKITRIGHSQTCTNYCFM